MSEEIYSQNLPVALANVTKKGITYSYGETNMSIAISFAYREELNGAIKEELISIFPNVDNNRYFIENNNIYFSIHLLKDSTKLELRLKQTHNSEKQFDEFKKKTKCFFKSILEL
ncbi:hypothetical protein BPO_p0091 (plasmid) [Bergeyella porcorum]|uniref:Uncharacterized protein n=1 Tax=Bergeyella porcorum TaxID=1735111 RepID=A0AAU0F691_9FLAO